SVWPEQFIEEIAEPRLEHVHLGLHNRDALRPIVRDGPIGKIVFDRATDTRPRSGPGIVAKIIWQHARSRSVGTIITVSCARAGIPTGSRDWSKSRIAQFYATIRCTAWRKNIGVVRD